MCPPLKNPGKKAPSGTATELATRRGGEGPWELGDVDSLLRSALVNHEVLTDWRLEAWKPSRSGKEFQYYTIELINASIAGFASEMPDSPAAGMPHEPRERVSFTYQKVVWTWQDGN